MQAVETTSTEYSLGSSAIRSEGASCVNQVSAALKAWTPEHFSCRELRTGMLDMSRHADRATARQEQHGQNTLHANRGRHTSILNRFVLLTPFAGERNRSRQNKKNEATAKSTTAGAMHLPTNPAGFKPGSVPRPCLRTSSRGRPGAESSTSRPAHRSCRLSMKPSGCGAPAP